MKTFIRATAVALISLGAVAHAEDSDSRNERASLRSSVDQSSKVAPDNSKRNAKIAKNDALTAEDQANDDVSLRLTQTIRKNILNRSDFSTYAKNVKIIADGSGAVTLKGPVRSQAEKEEIGRIASNATGTSRVNNELEIAPNS